MEDIIEDGVNGFFFSPNDPESLRRKIEEIASEKDRLEMVGSNARKTVLSRFSCTENLKKIEEFLEDEARGREGDRDCGIYGEWRQGMLGSWMWKGKSHYGLGKDVQKSDRNRHITSYDKVCREELCHISEWKLSQYTHKR
jgi:hypothetical protein